MRVSFSVLFIHMRYKLIWVRLCTEELEVPMDPPRRLVSYDLPDGVYGSRMALATCKLFSRFHPAHRVQDAVS